MKFIVIIVPVILDHYILLQNFPHFSAFFNLQEPGIMAELEVGAGLRSTFTSGEPQIKLALLADWLDSSICVFRV